MNAYRVQYVSLRESSGFDSPNVMNNTVLGTQTSVRIDNLQPSTWYMLRVAAQNENGLSDFSPETTSITRSLGKFVRCRNIRGSDPFPWPPLQSIYRCLYIGVFTMQPFPFPPRFTTNDNDAT